MGDMADYQRDNADLPWDGMYMSPEERKVDEEYAHPEPEDCDICDGEGVCNSCEGTGKA